MADLADFVQGLPDYNVFDDNNSTTSQRTQSRPVMAKPKGKRPETRKEKKRRRAAATRAASAEYRDGYGIYVERKTRGHDYLTVFFFPVLILWLEFSLRLGCSGDFGFNSIVYTGAFSMVFACALTVICTFGGRVFNLILSNLFTLILTLWFLLQLLYHGAHGSFLRVSELMGVDISELLPIINERLWVFILMIIPFLFSVITGWRVFTFRRIRIPAKISLVLLAVLIHLSAATMISLSKNNPYVDTSYNLYNKELKINESVDRFGILTTQRLDITDMFINRTKN